MKKIILEEKYLTDLDGMDLPNGEAGQIIANMLATQAGRGKDPVKPYLLALRFRKCEDIELDEADIKLVRDTAKDAEGFTVLVKAQVLLLLDEAKDVEE